MIVTLAFPPGINWLATYWLVVSAVGLVLGIDNLRAIHSRLALADRGTRVREWLVVELVVQILVAPFLALMTAIGVLLEVLGLRGMMRLSFENVATEVTFLVILLSLIAFAAAGAGFFWLRRWIAAR